MGLFEHLALNDETERIASRKALSLARVRAEKSFGRFIRAAKTVDDREARLTLVAGDLEELVKQACADSDYHAYDNILATVQEHLGFVVEARRPKMCPYHSEVTDISLAAGDAQAGFSAMAQHAWGPNHCQGEYEGRCNFKPEMTTQAYWDQKRERAEERRRQRDEQRQLELQQPQQIEPEIGQENEIENPVDETPVAPEPSAVGIGAEPAVAEPQMAMAAKTAEALKTIDVEQGEGPSPKMDKRKWTPENVRFLGDVDSKDGPHPTVDQDIAQSAQYKGDGLWAEDGRFDQTDAVLEKQDVEKSSNPTDGGGPATSTFPNKGQANPVTKEVQSAVDPNNMGGACPYCGGVGCPQCQGGVPPGSPQPVPPQPIPGQQPTASVDPDKNPIAEFLEEDEAQRAISEFNEK